MTCRYTIITEVENTLRTSDILGLDLVILLTIVLFLRVARLSSIEWGLIGSIFLHSLPMNLSLAFLIF